ncbi:MAG: hypothetical protein M3529_14495 [Actinomycetota bacterium]|nr:hypothetical protein [Actinomycetota bacterium]
MSRALGRGRSALSALALTALTLWVLMGSAAAFSTPVVSEGEPTGT